MLLALSIRRLSAVAFAVVSLCMAGVPVAAADPSLAQEEQQGGRIAEAVREGGKECSDLSADEFELIGEYAMGQYLGNEAAHSAMNQRMTQMMGVPGERRMHIALGYRYSGCSGGPASSWLEPMAGMMSGGGFEGRHHSGTMMGSGGGDDNGVSPGAVALIALAAAAIGAGAVAFAARRRRPRSGAAS